jgi:hypothetical protein
MNAFLPAFRIFEFPAEMKKYGLSNAILQAQRASEQGNNFVCSLAVQHVSA